MKNEANVIFGLDSGEEFIVQMSDFEAKKLFYILTGVYVLDDESMFI